MEEKRVFYHTNVNDTLSERQYNAAIGITILAGLMTTAFTTYLFKDSIGLFVSAHPFIFALIYLGSSLFLMPMIASRADIKLSLVGYAGLTVLTGGLLSGVIPYVETNILLNAAFATFGILAIMIVVSTAFPSAFSGLGRTLLVSLIVFLVVELLMILFGFYEPVIMDWIAVGIFTLYIGYDWATALEYPRTGTHAVIAALSLYLDIINIFIRLVSASSNSRKK